MKIYIISKVRGASQDLRERLEMYTKAMEKVGHLVWLPHRDTNQTQDGLRICEENARAMDGADEIHMFYAPESQGCHFDLGYCFAMGKVVRVIECPEDKDDKGFPAMLREYAK